MKINWFSPVPPTPSAISLVTVAALPALARRAEIVVWAHESVHEPSLEKHAQIRHYKPSAMPWQEINDADITVYHLGNQSYFHGPIWDVNRQHPGIVVLHDLNLQHFFSGLATHTNTISRRDYLRMMERHYPERGRKLGKALLAEAMTVDAVGEECPLTGAAIEHALGVAVHTKAGLAQLAELTDLPIAYVPLFTAETKESPRPELLRPAGEPYRIIIFGYLGLNRRLPSVLEALHRFPQKDRFHLDIYGKVADEKSLLRSINRLGLKKFTTLHGFVSDHELDDALRRSDFAINLRDPTMGEASASQLRIWQHGLPSLVTNIGWYATLPENTVALVRRELELEDIQAHLAAFLLAPEKYRNLGRNGRRHVEEHHTVEAYVNALMHLIDATLAAQPREDVHWMSARAGRLARPWFREGTADVAVRGAARAINEIFGANA